MKTVLTRAWLDAAAVRAVRTAAQTAIATIGTTAVALGDVPWLLTASAAALAGTLSLLHSLAGLPEVPAPDQTPPPAGVIEQ